MPHQRATHETEFEQGVFVVSLDFELYWGLHDQRPIESYYENLINTPKAVGHILDLFERFEVHATWAAVGALLLENPNEIGRGVTHRPGYQRSELCAYTYADRQHLDKRFHSALPLIERITTTPGQEIGSHTYSHFYCNEDGVTPESFSEDLRLAVATTRSRGVTPRSFVFPRNQCRDDFLPLLRDAGFICYRGNPSHSLYESRSWNDERVFWRRALRLIDAYIPLTGYNTFGPLQCLRQPIINVPASAFLRPVSRTLGKLEPLRQRRVTQAMAAAAKSKSGYHLWWHPHNFGSALEANLSFLEGILREFARLRDSFGMCSLNMSELSHKILGRKRDGN